MALSTLQMPQFSIFTPKSTLLTSSSSSNNSNTSFLSLSVPTTKSIKLSLSCSKIATLSHSCNSWKLGVVNCVAAATSEWVEVENEESEGEEEAVGEIEEGGLGFVDEEEEEVEEDVVVSEDAKVFVGNLSFEIDSEQLARIFGKAGTVEIAEVIYNRENGQSRGFAFVTMSTVEEAEKAVEMFHRYDINGRLLTVNKAAPRGAARPERVAQVFDDVPRIYVGNLPWQVDNEGLEQVFSEHGKVVEARVVYDRETGRSRGFGFVTMSSESEMQDAISALDGESLEGRSIKVNVAESRPLRSF